MANTAQCRYIHESTHNPLWSLGITRHAMLPYWIRYTPSHKVCYQRTLPCALIFSCLKALALRSRYTRTAVLPLIFTPRSVDAYTKDNSETWESWCHLSLWTYTWLGLWFITIKRRTKLHSSSALIVEVWWGEWAPPLPWIVDLLVTPDLVLVFGSWSYQQPWIWDQISDIWHSQPHVEKTCPDEFLPMDDIILWQPMARMIGSLQYSSMAVSVRGMIDLLHTLHPRNPHGSSFQNSTRPSLALLPNTALSSRDRFWPYEPACLIADNFMRWVPRKGDSTQVCAPAGVKASWFLLYGEALEYLSWPLLILIFLTETTVLDTNSGQGPCWSSFCWDIYPFISNPGTQNSIFKPGCIVPWPHGNQVIDRDRVIRFDKSPELEIPIRKISFTNNIQTTEASCAGYVIGYISKS